MIKLPNNQELEKEILSILLTRPKVLEEIEIKIEYFYNDKHAVIYEKMLECYNPKTQKISKRKLYSLLPKDCLEITTDLSNYFLTDVGVDKKVEELKKIWKQREFKKIIVEKNHELKNGKSIDEIVLSALKGLEVIINGNEDKGIEKIADIMQSYFEVLNKLVEEKENVIFFKTGYPDLDNMTKIKRGSLSIVAARPSMGKTTFAMNLIRKQVELGYRVGFFSLEMSKKQVVDKFCLMTTEINTKTIIEAQKEGLDIAEILTDMSKRVEDIEGWDLWIDDSPAMKLSSLVMKIKRLVNFQKVDLVYIDYLSYILPDRRENSKVLEIETITRTLKALAKELGIAIVLLSQLNRAVETRNNKRPILSDLRESGAIEQDADIVIMLYRPYYYNQREETRNILEVLIRKNREGETGDVPMLFFLEKQLIECGYWG